MRLLRTIAVALAIISLFFIASLKPVSAGAWTQNIIFSQSVTHPAISMGSDGYARVAYMLNGTNELQYIQCTNTACTTYNRTQTGITIGGDIRLIEGSDNFSRIITTVGISGLNLITCTNASCSTSTITELDASSDGYRDISARYGSDGYLRVLVNEIENGTVLYIVCTSTDCSTKTTTTVYVGFASGSYMDLTADDTARIAYGDYTFANLYYVLCTNITCSTSSTTTLDTGDADLEYVAEAINVELGSDGLARIAYFLSYDFKFIQCLNENCSTKAINQIPGSLQGNNELSLKLTGANLAKISYREFSQSDMKFVACNNLSCSTATITLIDGAASNSGAYNDMVLGSFDEGYIAFTDSDNSYLHFAYEAPDPTPTPTATPTPTQTPTPTPGQPGPQASIMGSTTETPTCNNPTPSHAPDLFQAVVRPQSATLYFSPVSGIHSYFLAFGRTPGSEEYGGELSYGDVSGVLAYQIEHLQPNSTYYVKLRGSNGCMPGDWSNILTITTPRSGSKLVYKDLASQVLSAFTNSSATASVPSTLGASTKSKKPSSCNYTVKPGDNLWDIASQLLGNGSLYQKIIQLNKLPNDQLNPGQRLKVC